MSLTKAKLADYLHKKMGFPKKDCLQIVETFFEEIILALEKGEEVKLPGLGNFSVVHKKSRPGRNPRTGKAHTISERNVINFFYFFLNLTNIINIHIIDMKNIC